MNNSLVRLGPLFAINLDWVLSITPSEDEQNPVAIVKMDNHEQTTYVLTVEETAKLVQALGWQEQKYTGPELIVQKQRSTPGQGIYPSLRSLADRLGDAPQLRTTWEGLEPYFREGIRDESLPVPPPSRTMSIAGLSGGLDQIRPVPNLAPYLSDIVSQVAKPTAQLSDGLTILRGLTDLGQMTAVGKAAVLWTLRDQWPRLVNQTTGQTFTDGDEADDHFFQMIFSELGYMPDTVRRYLLAWDFVRFAQQFVKGDIYEAILQRDIKDLIALGQNRNEWGDFTPTHLKRISEQPDPASLRKTLREIRGTDPATPPVQFVLSKDGALNVWEGDQVEALGYITQPITEIGRKGRARLIRLLKLREEE